MNDHDLLIQIDTKLNSLGQDFKDLKSGLDEGRFPSKESFETLKESHENLQKIVYGIISIPLVGFLMALVYLVWKQQ